MRHRVIEMVDGWMIRCEAHGANQTGFHVFPKIGKPGKSWTFNGNLFEPTFSPSMNEACNLASMAGYNPDAPSSRCHFVVNAGWIYYCNDCTHNFRERHMPLLEWDQVQIDYYKALLKRTGE